MEQEINEDREANLEKVNMHLERLLDKSDKDHALLRHMAFHYMARNKVCKARIRNLKAKLRKAIKKQKRQRELDRIQILAKASLAKHSTSYRTSSPNFRKFGAILVTWKIFGHNTGFFSLALRIGISKSLMVCIFGFSMKNSDYWYLYKKFGHDLSLQEVKHTQKMTSLPLF